MHLSKCGRRLGGVVSVAGHLLEESCESSAEVARVGTRMGADTMGADTMGADTMGADTMGAETPVLIIAGGSDELTPLAEARRRCAWLQRAMAGRKGARETQSVTLSEIAGKGHQMVSSEAEMRIVMQFFAAHLELRSMALEAHARDGELLPVRMGADGDLELLDGATSSLRL